MPDVYSLLYQAIQQRKQVTAMYDGYQRELCPHLLGSKNGVRHVLSFQFAGGSSRGLPPGGQWKCMNVDGLSNVSLRDGPWLTGQGTTGKPQTCVENVDISVGL